MGQNPPEGANDVQDAVHAILVAVLPNAAAKVVHVHNERRSEAARAHRLSRHCGEHTEYPYLPDLVFNDSLFQVQHRLDYLQCFSQASDASRSQFRLSSFLERCLER